MCVRPGCAAGLRGGRGAALLVSPGSDALSEERAAQVRGDAPRDQAVLLPRAQGHELGSQRESRVGGRAGQYLLLLLLLLLAKESSTVERSSKYPASVFQPENLALRRNIPSIVGATPPTTVLPPPRAAAGRGAAMRGAGELATLQLLPRASAPCEELERVANRAEPPAELNSEPHFVRWVAWEEEREAPLMDLLMFVVDWEWARVSTTLCELTRSTSMERVGRSSIPP